MFTSQTFPAEICQRSRASSAEKKIYKGVRPPMVGSSRHNSALCKRGWEWPEQYWYVFIAQHLYFPSSHAQRFLSLSRSQVYSVKIMRDRKGGSHCQGGHVKASLGGLWSAWCNLSRSAFKQWLLVFYKGVTFFLLLIDMGALHYFSPFSC